MMIEGEARYTFADLLAAYNQGLQAGFDTSTGSAPAAETPEQKAIGEAWEALWTIGREAELRAGYNNPRYDMTFDHIYEQAWGAMEAMRKFVGTVPLPRHSWETGSDGGPVAEGVTNREDGQHEATQEAPRVDRPRVGEGQPGERQLPDAGLGDAQAIAPATVDAAADVEQHGVPVIVRDCVPDGCRCRCHTTPGVHHMVACCDAPPYREPSTEELAAADVSTPGSTGPEWDAGWEAGYRRGWDAAAAGDSAGTEDTMHALAQELIQVRARLGTLDHNYAREGLPSSDALLAYNAWDKATVSQQSDRCNAQEPHGPHRFQFGLGPDAEVRMCPGLTDSQGGES